VYHIQFATFGLFLRRQRFQTQLNYRTTQMCQMAGYINRSVCQHSRECGLTLCRTLSFPMVAVTIACTHYMYLQRHGHTELARVAWWNTKMSPISVLTSMLPQSKTATGKPIKITSAVASSTGWMPYHQCPQTVLKAKN